MLVIISVLQMTKVKLKRLNNLPTILANKQKNQDSNKGLRSRAFAPKHNVVLIEGKTKEKGISGQENSILKGPAAWKSTEPAHYNWNVCVRRRTMEDKDRKGDSDLMVIDSMEGGGEISGNNGESLKHFRKKNNLFRWLFDQKDNWLEAAFQK